MVTRCQYFPYFLDCFLLYYQGIRYRFLFCEGTMKPKKKLLFLLCYGIGISGNSLSASGEIFLRTDSFRSLPQGSWNGNTGLSVGGNLACLLPYQKEGIGLQGGGSFGFYDWDGRGSDDSKALQRESFLTLGVFRKTLQGEGWNGGACYDWLFGGKYGVFGLSPTLTQVRGQIGYLFGMTNEIGLLGSYATRLTKKHVDAMPVAFRAVSQVNVFWRYLFSGKAEAMIWTGTPYAKGLMYKSGRSGTYLVGARFKAPLTGSLFLTGHGVYMGARGNKTALQSRNYAADVCFGLTYAFGGKGGVDPYMPVADNSNFLVDTDVNY